MRTAWTPHAPTASSLAGEAIVSGSTGQDSLKIGSVKFGPVAIDQFPAVILNTAVQSSAARPKAAYIVAWRRCVAPT
ncbi:hypothetical protein ACVWWI_000224 [Bradyrhizobium sp. USDA 3686]|uniref:Uncharacterized protein n=1 Tax=Bradyrhizobium canariense TaxID=255045 RepID=A0A1X3EDJ5_9BRAD|nr:hypothetical protein [Bradyrhizobium canariense]OSI25956.1 hypothetical protein BST65_13455 [Bradyrhizobium canariense]OSI34150.1 hypothetical protein BST66_11240 [Bradyrhizobium canariense]OSI42219.1 hypothetical protein BSZ20_17965 [Bradyrhizobium canariense]OSI50347.1 hypothetical protein BST67_15235 [Bradyrhizobium canariense]